MMIAQVVFLTQSALQAPTGLPYDDFDPVLLLGLCGVAAVIAVVVGLCCHSVKGRIRELPQIRARSKHYRAVGAKIRPFNPGW